MNNNNFNAPVQNVADEINIHQSVYPCIKCSRLLRFEHYERYPYCNICIKSQQNEAIEKQEFKIRWTIISVAVILFLLIFFTNFVLPLIQHNGQIDYIENAKLNPPIKLLLIPLSIWGILGIFASSLVIIRYRESKLRRKIEKEIPLHEGLSSS